MTTTEHELTTGQLAEEVIRLQSAPTAEALDRLDELHVPPQQSYNGRRPASKLFTLPDIFQPRGSRGFNKSFARRLKARLEQQGKLDKIDVLPVSGGYIVVDGHHRLFAYRSLGRGYIPVRVLTASPRDAALHASRVNGKEQLLMNDRQRSERAWKLFLTGKFSQSEIARHAVVSQRHVEHMARARKYIERHMKTDLNDVSWAKARMWWKKLDLEQEDNEMTYDERRQTVEEAKRRLAKSVRAWEQRHPDVLGEAIREAFPEEAIRQAMKTLAQDDQDFDDNDPVDDHIERPF